VSAAVAVEASASRHPSKLRDVCTLLFGPCTGRVVAEGRSLGGSRCHRPGEPDATAPAYTYLGSPSRTPATLAPCDTG
jgi:hypothetical protein